MGIRMMVLRRKWLNIKIWFKYIFSHSILWDREFYLKEIRRLSSEIGDTNAKINETQKKADANREYILDLDALLDKHTKRLIALGKSEKKAKEHKKEIEHKIDYCVERIGHAETNLDVKINNMELYAKRIFDLVKDIEAFKKYVQRSDKLEKQLHDIIEKVNKYKADFGTIENVSIDLKDEFDAYMKEMRDFSESHQIPRRVASVETRITQLEISHNGSGKTIPGSVAANQG